MRIRITREHSETIKHAELSQLIENKVDGSDYERGELEAIKATLRNQTRLLAWIIEKLNPTNEELTERLGEWGEKLEKAE